ncbi:MAG: hypothetical protein ACE366_07245 [Bradymonadia bacterium]
MANPISGKLKRLGLDVLLRVAGDPRVLMAVVRGTDVRARLGRSAVEAVVEGLASVGAASGADMAGLTEEVARLGDRVQGLSGALDRLEATLDRIHPEPTDEG